MIITFLSRLLASYQLATADTHSAPQLEGHGTPRQPAPRQCGPGQCVPRHSAPRLSTPETICPGRQYASKTMCPRDNMHGCPPTIPRMVSREPKDGHLVWPCLAPFDTIGPGFPMFGPSWPRSAPFGFVWPRLAPFGPVWPCLAFLTPSVHV